MTHCQDEIVMFLMLFKYKDHLKEWNMWPLLKIEDISDN